jgi:hypothetical protein
VKQSRVEQVLEVLVGRAELNFRVGCIDVELGLYSVRDLAFAEEAVHDPPRQEREFAVFQAAEEVRDATPRASAHERDT